jgi:hypothetical protein
MMASEHLLRDARGKKKTRNKMMASEHHPQLGLKEEQEEENEETKKEEETKGESKEEEPWDECEGYFPDTYPPPPLLEEQVPDDLPRAEDEETPAEDYE